MKKNIRPPIPETGEIKKTFSSPFQQSQVK